MSPARKRATKTTKKVARKAAGKKAPKAGAKKKATAKPAKKTAPKSAKQAAAKKTPRKAVKKTAGREPKEASEKQSRARADSAKKPQAAVPMRGAGSKTRPAKGTRKRTKRVVARPVGSAEKTPRLGAKWACFHCGAKFYDLNRPDPICPKCSTDQRDQPAKAAAVVPPPAKKRPATPPISRLLDEEEAPEAPFDEEADAEGAAELDIGKLNGGVEYLDDTEFSEESDD